MPCDVSNQRGCLTSCSGKAFVFLPVQFGIGCNWQEINKAKFIEQLKVGVKPADMKHWQRQRCGNLSSRRTIQAFKKNLESSLCTLCHARHDTYIFKVPTFQLNNFISLCLGKMAENTCETILVNFWWNEKPEYVTAVRTQMEFQSFVRSIESAGCCQRLHLDHFLVKNSPPNVQSKYGDTTYSFRASRGAELSMGKNFISQWRNLPIIIISYRTNSTAQGGLGS